MATKSKDDDVPLRAEDIDEMTGSGDLCAVLRDEPPALAVSVSAGARKWASGRCEETTDCIAEEVPVALVYNGVSHAVMMSTPADLGDFALGFSLSEGIVEHPREVREIQFQETDKGIAVHLSISSRRFAACAEPI